MNKYSMRSDSIVTEIDKMSPGYKVGKILITTKNQEYLFSSIADKFMQTVNNLNVYCSRSNMLTYVEEFFLEYIPGIPKNMLDAQGSTPLVGLLPLWLLLKSIKPDVVIESGVFIGSSLRMARAAAPQSDIYAFDVSFEKLLEKDDSITYHEDDWATFKGRLGSGTRFAFFDDHINCAKRICESKERGITFAAFDDCPNFGMLSWYRYPAVPSIPMIMDTSIPPGAEFEWNHKPTNTTLRYTHDREKSELARNHIQCAQKLGVFEDILGIRDDKYAVRLK